MLPQIKVENNYDYDTSKNTTTKSTNANKLIIKKYSYSRFTGPRDRGKHGEGSIMIIISLIMILLAFSYLGGASGIFAIIACVILFVGLIGNTIYNKQVPKDSTAGLANEEVEQAKKICKKLANSVEGGILNKIFGQAGGSGEDKLLSKLKKLSKELKK